MACEDSYIDCNNANLGTDSLLRMLLADVDGQPAIRTCGDSGGLSNPGGQYVDHFIATAGQTSFTLANPVRLEAAWFRNGAIQHNAPTFSAGSNLITLPSQPLGTEITIIS